MRKVICFTSFLCCFILAHQGMGRETITVTVTGLGATVEGARKSAIQKAVRKALGEVVDAETIAKNGELIKDEVLTYSDGFISKTVDISGPEKDADLGLFTLTIQAEVIRSKVVKRLKEVNIKVVEIDGNSLFAQALSKMEKAQSGQQLLAKVLNEDLDPAKLIKCETVALNADGKLIRGKEAITSPDSLKALDEERVELTIYWEISIDLEAYYKRALPRLSKVINQVSKRKVSENISRHLRYSYYDRNNDKVFYSFPTKQPFFFSYGYAGNYSILKQKWDNVYLGREPNKTDDLKIFDSDSSSKISPWRISNKEEEFFVAFELRSQPDRSKADYEVHVLDSPDFLDIFLNSTSRIFPAFQLSVLDREKEVISQSVISQPRFLIANNKDKQILRKKSMLHNYWISVNDGADPLKGTPVGLNKIHSDSKTACSFTINPEIPIESENENGDEEGNWMGGAALVHSSVVMEIKEVFTKQQLQNLSEIRMQPISRNAN